MGRQSVALVDEVVDHDWVIEDLRVKVVFGMACWRGDRSTTPRVLRALLGGLQPSDACEERMCPEGYGEVIGRSEGFKVAVWNIREGGRGFLGVPASKSRS